MSDKKTSRFSLIMEELADPKPAPVEVEVEAAGRDSLVVTGPSAVSCPLCGCSAFERRPNSESVVCRGCPPPTPPATAASYSIPEGVALDAAEYVCGSCYCVSVVTILLDRVNLHCPVCFGLRLHARRYGTRDVRTVLRRTRWNLGTTETSFRQLAPMTKIPPATFKFKFSYLLDTMTDASQPPFDKNACVDQIRRATGLDDFNEYARKQILQNMERSLREQDLARGSGRTTKGIVEAIALCQERQASQMWVRSVSQNHEDDISQKVVWMRDQACLDYPSRVVTRRTPRFPNSDNPYPDVVVFTDHSFKGPA